MMGEQSQEPQYNATFMQSIILAPIPAAINVFAKESLKKNLMTLIMIR
jgi:hypothetical protein